MDAHEILAQFTIPAPCPMDWNRMSGDDRKRYCEACGKHVYNLTGMSRDEIVSVLTPFREEGGELCGRLYERPDGGLAAADDAPVLAAARRQWQFSIRSLMALIAVLAASFGFMRLATPTERRVRLGAIRPRMTTAAPGVGGPSCTSEATEDGEGECPLEGDETP